MLGRMRETQETLLYLEKRLYYDDLARQHTPPDGEQQVPLPPHLTARNEEASPAVPLRME